MDVVLAVKKKLFLSCCILLWLLITPSSCQGNKKNFYPFRYPFIKKASSFPAESSFSSSSGDNGYDYIVVGGGTAGCPLAATLSQNFSVLLLERGGVPFSNANVSFLKNFHITLADTSPASASQYFVSTDGVLNTRARVLGGGTCINAGFYTRANPRLGAKVDKVQLRGDLGTVHLAWSFASCLLTIAKMLLKLK